jgi:hypothetical protein
MFHNFDDNWSGPHKTISPPVILNFPHTVQKSGFNIMDPSQSDIFARITFHLFPFLFHFDRHVLYQYLNQRKNNYAIEYTLGDCDLVGLAQTLRDTLR